MNSQESELATAWTVSQKSHRLPGDCEPNLMKSQPGRKPSRPSARARLIGDRAVGVASMNQEGFAKTAIGSSSTE